MVVSPLVALAAAILKKNRLAVGAAITFAASIVLALLIGIASLFL
jgi:hypothetical protein